MLSKLAKQLGRMLLLLVAVSIIAFALVSASPVDPVQQYLLGVGPVSQEQRAQLEEYWGVNEPPVQRYFRWLNAVLHGDLGQSLIYRRPVIQVIGERFLSSLALMVTAWLLAGILGFTIGCIMGIQPGKAPDRILKKLCFLLNSAPSFWLGLLLMLIFSVKLGWFPVGFSAPIGALSQNVTLAQRIHHLILPAITLSLMSFSDIALHTREKLVEVMTSDYVLFARARGESTRCIFFRHGIRNILLPAITLQWGSFAELFGGSVMAETIFSYPGLGSAISQAGLQSDVPLLLGITLFSALFVSVGNLLAELLYRVIDPRIREVHK